jgi:hypothetical protein
MGNFKNKYHVNMFTLLCLQLDINVTNIFHFLSHIQVNFLAPQLLTGVITQGRHNVPSYVTSYKVFYSTDGFHWTAYQDKGVDKVMKAFIQFGITSENVIYSFAEELPCCLIL